MASAQKTNSTQTSPNIDIGNPYTPRRPAPIISISVNHPLATAARKIKNFLIHKQTLFSTTFSIKITPIVAIISLAGVAALFCGGITTAYNFGKTVEQKFLTNHSASSGQATPSTTPTPLIPVIIPNVSKSGTVKATYQLPPLTPTAQPTIQSNEITLGSDSGQARMTITITPTPSYGSVLHYILVAKNGSITYLSSSTVKLQNYLNLRVLITGSFDSSKNTLTVTKSTDIEILQ